MHVITAFRVAIQALARHRTRTGLTILGIMVGIGAVLCTVALGEGSASKVHDDLLNLGESFVWIENGNRTVAGVRSGLGGAPRLTPEDMTAILTDVPEIARCSPQVDTRIQVIFGNQNWRTTYRGVSPDYLQIRRWSVVRGTPFSEADVASRAKVALLGATVVENLFGDDDPLDQTFRMGSQLFRVVGVLSPKGVSSGGQNQDDFVLIPYTTALRNLKGGTTLDDVMCSATSDAHVPAARDHITTVLRDRHRIAEGQTDDFNLQTPDDQIRLREEAANTMKMMLAGIASVSLLVGGIGIMNIMLVSVTERTREIGIRLAIGARPRDVTRQFLAEALVLGLLGGATGIAGGLVAAHVMAGSAGWPIVISLRTIVVAVTFASGVGLVFGYYPARHAASLDPIDALRAE